MRDGNGGLRVSLAWEVVYIPTGWVEFYAGGHFVHRTRPVREPDEGKGKVDEIAVARETAVRLFGELLRFADDTGDDRG